VGTGQNFVPGDAQVERPLRVIATYVDGLGVNESVTSSATAPVQNVNDAPTGLVSIDDISPVVTQTLFVSNTLADADGMGVVGYQWQSSTNGVDWSDIVGETGNSYTAATVGVQLRVAASYTDVRGANETVFSSPVTAVVAAYNVITGTPDVDNLVGTDLPDQMFGLASDDVLSSGVGDDWIDGGAGADLMIGGQGNDTYVVDNLGDQIIDTAGVDTVMTTLSDLDLGANLENITLLGGGNIHAIGNGLDNLIVGNTGNNRLWGLGGNDTLLGNAGQDTLNGGVGADELRGEGGNDLYQIDNVNDVVIELAGGGNADEVRTTLSSYTLADEVELLRFNGLGAFSGTGNASNNRIWGGTSGDTLDGGVGNDTLNGGQGDDTYLVDSAGDVIQDGGGIDTVISSGTAYTLGNNVEHLISLNAVGAALNGNGLANQITGGSGADSIFGGNGNDTIEGGAGNDTMAGGGNNDVFVFNAGFGADTINGFDSNPLNGQDLLDISGLGISAATFGAEVNITGVVGTGTVVSFTGSADTITLIGVNAANVTVQDFILA